MSQTPLPAPSRMSVAGSGVAGVCVGALVGQVGLVEVIVLAVLCALPLPTLAAHRRTRLTRVPARGRDEHAARALLHRRVVLTFAFLAAGVLVGGLVSTLVL